jgi:hypothetical protein
MERELLWKVREAHNDAIQWGVDVNSDGSSESGCVVDLVVSLHWVQRLGQECDGVPRIVVDLLLGEDCTSSDARAVGL